MAHDVDKVFEMLDNEVQTKLKAKNANTWPPGHIYILSDEIANKRFNIHFTVTTADPDGVDTEFYTYIASYSGMLSAKEGTEVLRRFAEKYNLKPPYIHEKFLGYEKHLITETAVRMFTKLSTSRSHELMPHIQLSDVRKFLKDNFTIEQVEDVLQHLKNGGSNSNGQ